MHTIEVFIFGLVNFAILIALLFKMLGKIARQYLYARRLNLKKEMISASGTLRAAKRRLLKASEIMKNIEKDIEERKRSGLALIQKDCDAALITAKKRADRIMASARSFMEAEKAKALLTMKKNISARAIEKVIKKLDKQISEDLKKQILDSGVKDFTIESRQSKLGAASV